MEWRTEKLRRKLLIGFKMKMSYSDNRTGELWRSFMPHRHGIRNRVSDDLISMQVYGADFDFSRFNPFVSFEKWATAEVSNFDYVPEGMETFIIPQGLYAVFLYKGSSADGSKVFGYIFGEWLPGSPYVIDNRPHFEVLGAKYKNNDPDSEEEIWVPIRLRTDSKV